MQATRRRFAFGFIQRLAVALHALQSIYTRTRTHAPFRWGLDTVLKLPEPLQLTGHAHLTTAHTAAERAERMPGGMDTDHVMRVCIGIQ